MRPTNERRGGAQYQVPNGKEVTPTKLWTLAVLAVAAWITRFAVAAYAQVLRF